MVTIAFVILITVKGGILEWITLLSNYGFHFICISDILVAGNGHEAVLRQMF